MESVDLIFTDGVEPHPLSKPGDVKGGSFFPCFDSPEPVAFELNRVDIQPMFHIYANMTQDFGFGSILNTMSSKDVVEYAKIVCRFTDFTKGDPDWEGILGDIVCRKLSLKEFEELRRPTSATEFLSKVAKKLKDSETVKMESKNPFD